MAEGGSEPVFDFYCEFCNEEGLHKEAAGHCTECDEYLCGSCIVHHIKRNRFTRHHEILDIDTMPRDTPHFSDHVRKDITTMCKQHKGEPVKYNCQTHDELTCRICYDKDNTSCTDVTNSTEINSMFNDKEYMDFKKKLKDLKNQVHVLSKKSRDLLPASKRYCSEAKQSVEQLRAKTNTAEINSALDKLKDKADDKKYEDVLKMENLDNTCSTFLRTIDRISLEFAGLESENRVDQVVIRLKEAQVYIKMMDEQRKKIEDKFDSHARNMEAFWKISVIDIEKKKGKKTSPISSTASYVQDEKNVLCMDRDNTVKEDLKTSSVSNTVNSLDITNEKKRQTSSMISNSTSVSIQDENVLHTDNADEKNQQKKDTVSNSQPESKSAKNVKIYQKDSKIQQKSIKVSNSQKQALYDKTKFNMVEEKDDKQQDTDPVSNYSASSVHDQNLSHKEKEYDKKQRNTDSVSDSDSSALPLHDQNLSHKDKEHDKIQRNTDSVSVSNISASSDQDENRICIGKKDGIQKTKTSPVSNSLVVSNAISSASFVQDIHVSSSSSYFRSISGSVFLSSSKLVLVDYIMRSSTIKLVDMRSLMITCEQDISGYLCDITVIKEDQVAVTDYNNNTIFILKVTDTLTLEREINVSRQCQGIDYSKNQLVVTYINPPHIEIMDLYGNVNSKIENDKDGNTLFKFPQYACTSSDGDTLYVSDYTAHKVVSLSRDGSVKAVYTDTDLRGPGKVCLHHRGNVFVYGYWSKTIHMLTPDCTKIKVILTQTNGYPEGPMFISHCRQTDRLFVGMNSDIIKVFQLS